PQRSDSACMEAMQLVLPDGRVLAGADAVPELLRRIRGLGWLATLFALPAARPLARRFYAWVARNRMRLSCRRSAPQSGGSSAPPPRVPRLPIKTAGRGRIPADVAYHYS